MSTDDLHAFVRALPKAELHVHLEGSITPELALVLAQRHGVKLPGAESGVQGLRAAWRFPEFRSFITTYLAISSCLNEADDLVRVLDDLAGRLVDAGVRHVELTFTPMTHIDRGVAVDVLVAGLAEGRAAAHDRGLSLGFVFDIVRSLPDRAAPTLSFAQALRRRDPDAVTGLGVGGPEGEQYPLEEIARVLAHGRAEGLHSLPHAGEQRGPASIRSAIDLLGAERIGHGVRCLEDPALVAEIRDRGIALEVCPSSNVALGVVPSLAEHPMPRLRDAGLRLSLATDDPGLFATDLVDEYVRCAIAFGWSEADIVALVQASLEQAFVDEGRRRAWQVELRAAVDATVSNR